MTTRETERDGQDAAVGQERALHRHDARIRPLPDQVRVGPGSLERADEREDPAEEEPRPPTASQSIPIRL